MIELRNVWRFYGDRPALRGVDLTVEKGASMALIGPNGSGKTTTLRVLATLDRPTAGTVRVGGADALERPDRVRARLGFMPDEARPPDDLTVREYLTYFARAFRVVGPPQTRVSAVVDLCRLDAVADKRPNELSKGWRQRVLLARTLVHDPAVLVLDEPTNGLDPAARIEFREVMRELQAAGKTLIVSSHFLPELADFCDTIGMIEQGRTLVCDRIDAVHRRLGAGVVLHIEVVGEPGPALAALESDAEVERVSPPEPTAEGVFRIEAVLHTAETAGAEGDAAIRAAILARLVGGGVRVSAVTVHRRTLDDIFMQIGLVGDTSELAEADGMAPAPHQAETRRAILDEIGVRPRRGERRA